MKDILIRTAVMNYYNHCIGTENIIANIINIFSISRSTFYNWKKMHNNGTMIPKTPGRPKDSTKFTEKIHLFIVGKFTDGKYHSIKNIRRTIKRKFKVTIRKSSIYRILTKNKITYKRVSVDRSPYTDKDKKNKYELLANNLGVENMESNLDNIISFDESFMSP